MKKINEAELYSPKQIANYKFIKSSRGGISYNFVLDEIKRYLNGDADGLIARNVGKGKIPYYRCLGADILIYQKQHNLHVVIFDKEVDAV